MSKSVMLILLLAPLVSSAGINLQRGSELYSTDSQTAVEDTLSPSYICIYSPTGVDAKLFHSLSYAIGVRDAQGSGKYSMSNVKNIGDQACFPTYTYNPTHPVIPYLSPNHTVSGAAAHYIKCPLPSGYDNFKDSSSKNPEAAFFTLVNHKDHTITCAFNHLGLME